MFQPVSALSGDDLGISTIIYQQRGNFSLAIRHDHLADTMDEMKRPPATVEKERTDKSFSALQWLTTTTTQQMATFVKTVGAYFGGRKQNEMKYIVSTASQGQFSQEHATLFL